jgi:group II intron reverse transcriptase/maturase
MQETKQYNISKLAVKLAYEKVKANNGTHGVDGQSIAEFEQDLKNNLYKIWNRMSSGSYIPKPVKAVPIKKKNGGTRILGIPTVEDRIAQMTAKLYFEPQVEPVFHADSYGYRPNKSAIDALEVTRKRCWKHAWVLEYDIKGLFDNINHEILIKMAKRHAKEEWVVLYISRWLTAPFELGDGSLLERTSGTPQGGVISPVLANLFLHYVFDKFMENEFKTIPWARYADDAVAHCTTQKQAKYLLVRLEERFGQYGLELNLEKTKIVYCKSSSRTLEYPNISFDFLGYTFRPRLSKSKKNGTFFVGFLPAIADKSKKAIRKEIRRWKLQLKTDKDLVALSKLVNSKIQGWINYYKHFYKSELHEILRYINNAIVKWVRRKYSKKLTRRRKAEHWLGRIARREKNVFAHWKIGILPAAE